MQQHEGHVEQEHDTEGDDDELVHDHRPPGPADREDGAPGRVRADCTALA
jgi:hypothetical protein